MTADRRYEIDKIMFNQVWYGGDRSDVPEDMFWIWYDTDEMEDVNERDEAYRTVEAYLVENNII